jgi:hypothetical protein
MRLLVTKEGVPHGSLIKNIGEDFFDLFQGEDYMAIYETIDRKRQEAKEFKVSMLLHSISDA